MLRAWVWLFLSPVAAVLALAACAPLSLGAGGRPLGLWSSAASPPWRQQGMGFVVTSAAGSVTEELVKRVAESMEPS